MIVWLALGTATWGIGVPQHEKVGLELFDGGDTVLVREQAIGVAPPVVFASLAGSHDWTEWLGLHSVTYTTEPPRGVGTRRTVKALPGPLGIDEHFLAWDDPTRLAFRFDASPFPVRAFGEDYRLTEQPDGSTLLTWTVVIDGGPAPVRAVVAGIMRVLMARLPRLATLLESRAA